MNFNKLLTISIILMLFSVSLGVVSADSSGPIDLGKITTSDFEITDVTSKDSIPSPAPSTSIGSTNLYDVDFTAKFEIDISKMSDADKKLLTEAVDDENTSFILNLTSDHKISVEMYKGAEFSIDGDTLKIDASTYYTSIDNSKDVTVESVGLRSSDNQLFIAEMD